MARVHEKLASWVVQRALEDIVLKHTPQYDLYEDERQNKQTFFQLTNELKPMLEVADHYIGADVLLPRGDQMTRSHEVVWSHDAIGNVIGRAYENPILDTRMYQIEFDGGEIAELMVNIIAESIHSKCDAVGNEYLLLDSLIDYCKDEKMISLTNQKTIIQGRLVTHKFPMCYQRKDGPASWEMLSN